MDPETLIPITDALRTGVIAVGFILAVAFIVRYGAKRTPQGRPAWRVWEEGRHVMWMTVTLAFTLAIFLIGRLVPDDIEPWWFQPVFYVIAFGALTYQLAWRHTLLELSPAYAERWARARQLLRRKVTSDD